MDEIITGAAINKNEDIEDFILGLQRKLKSLKHTVKKNLEEKNVTIEFFDEAGYPEEYYVVSDYLYKLIINNIK